MAKKEKKLLKELVKMSKELNDLELTGDPIDVDEDDADALKEEFIQAIEEIDDDGKIDDVDEDIVDFYESLINGNGKGKKDKKDKKDKDEGGNGEEFDADECREEIEDFSVKEMKEYIEENDLDIDTKVKKSTLEDVVEEVVEAMEEAAEEKVKAKKKKDKKKGKGKGKGKKDKKDKKDKKKKKDKDDGVDLPKGIRKGTLPAKVFACIGEDGATLEKIAKVVAKEKDKDVDQVINLALRTIIRKVSAAVPIIGKFTGDEESAFFTVEEED